MKLLYYNIFICKDGQKTSYPIERLIDFINNGTPLERTTVVEGKTIFLSKHRYPNQGRSAGGRSQDGSEYETSNRSLWLGKFLDDKPFAGEIGSDNLDEILGDVYQPNTCLFVSDSKLLIMEYNFNGPRKLQIENFLTKYLNQNGDSQYTVKLIQIVKPRAMNLVSASDSIKSISITVKNDNFQILNLFPNPGNSEGVLERLFNGPVAVSNQYDVNETTVVLKKGRMRRNMNVDDVTNILLLLDADSPLLVSAKVSFLNPETNDVDTIDLKHDGFYTSNVNCENLTGFEYLANQVTSHYYDEQGSNKNAEFHQYLGEIIHIEVNEIQFGYPTEPTIEDDV
ncbi:DUF6731 family protein [Marinilactibacillus sp. XAAS-LB27]|uniref:DUF6731 family protein n=1 Tax=Marinilactibacillus sp. XAAS-LB27 TaxID=3114538 RepID=UPI002E18FE49|nr:DUF6731 family protein [Marinilactibacillus sp. XAAS-LB27]